MPNRKQYNGDWVGFRAVMSRKGEKIAKKPAKNELL